MKKTCTNTKVFLEERKRMCAYHTGGGQCKTSDGIVCPFSDGINASCNDMLWENIDGAIAIVQKWSDDHQQETVLEHICKLLPNCCFDTEDICCQQLDCTLEPYNDDACGCYGCCNECWNRIYEKAKGE